MMNKLHHYTMRLVWTGNRDDGTATYRSYDRSYTISINNKADFYGTADPVFRGDPTKHNPEELFVMSLSSCHLLSYLHLCAVNGIVLTDYEDDAKGSMEEDDVKGGYISDVTLNITMRITDISKKKLAEELHHQANKLCFIANSVNFQVKHNITILASLL